MQACQKMKLLYVLTTQWVLLTKLSPRFLTSWFKPLGSYSILWSLENHYLLNVISPAGYFIFIMSSCIKVYKSLETYVWLPFSHGCPNFQANLISSYLLLDQLCFVCLTCLTFQLVLGGLFLWHIEYIPRRNCLHL